MATHGSRCPEQLCFGLAIRLGFAPDFQPTQVTAAYDQRMRVRSIAMGGSGASEERDAGIPAAAQGQHRTLPSEALDQEVENPFRLLLGAQLARHGVAQPVEGGDLLDPIVEPQVLAANLLERPVQVLLLTHHLFYGGAGGARELQQAPQPSAQGHAPRRADPEARPPGRDLGFDRGVPMAEDVRQHAQAGLVEPEEMLATPVALGNLELDPQAPVGKIRVGEADVAREGRSNPVANHAVEDPCIRDQHAEQAEQPERGGVERRDRRRREGLRAQQLREPLEQLDVRVPVDPAGGIP